MSMGIIWTESGTSMEQQKGLHKTGGNINVRQKYMGIHRVPNQQNQTIIHCLTWQIRSLEINQQNFISY